jgi:hypothetical protein
MDIGLQAAIGAIVCATTIELSAEQTATPQNLAAAGQASPARNHVVIGCVSREAQSTTPDRDAAGGAAFIITDTRGKPPLMYRLDGDADQLRMHVGHTLEITGPIVPTSSARGGANAGTPVPTLKVQSLTYISMTCPK